MGRGPARFQMVPEAPFSSGMAEGVGEVTKFRNSGPGEPLGMAEVTGEFLC